MRRSSLVNDLVSPAHVQARSSPLGLDPFTNMCPTNITGSTMGVRCVRTCKCRLSNWGYFNITGLTSLRSDSSCV